MPLSRSELAAKYALSEQTLVQLEELDDSPLIDGSNQKTVRGRIVYEVTPELDRWLRVGRTQFTQFRGRLMPCQRAIFSALIAEADVTRAYSSLRERGVIPPFMNANLIGVYWQELLRLAPPECLPFLTGQQQEPDDLSRLMMQQLGILDAFEDPERLAEKFYWLNTPDLRVLTDAFLAVQSDTQTLKKYLSDAHRFDVTDASIREYRRYFFDIAVCGMEGAAAFADLAASPQYRSVVGNALRDGTLGSVVSELKLSSLIDHRISLEAALTRSRAFVATNPSKSAGVQAQVGAFKAMQDLYYTVHTLEHAKDKDEGTSDAAMMEILKLKHNQTVNENQLSINDIPKEARDAIVTGPVKARS